MSGVSMLLCLYTMVLDLANFKGEVPSDTGNF